MVGAGPGDPELLTVKALRVLEHCDVVLYDRLVGKEILKLINPAAQRLDVGKREGEQELIQQNIFQLLLEHACAGKNVVRLKGGDPLVFGRGAEEWALAIKYGVDVELVPGVSSAIAVPGLAGIPLTFRKVSRSFAVVTGHSGDDADEDWSRFVHIDTLILLMAVKKRALIARALIEAGRTAMNRWLLWSGARRRDERVVVSTLGAVADEKVMVKNPAVFVIGKVVQLREMLSSFAAS